MNQRNAADAQQDIAIAEILKDVQYLREAMVNNFKDHDEIKLVLKEGLRDKISKARFKPVELITFSLAGLVMGSVVIALVAQVVYSFN